MRPRRKSVPVRVGNVVIGGAAEIVVQSMTKADTRDVKATLNEIARLKDANCRIVRVAVPTKEAALAMVEIKKASPLPIIADIHYDAPLALMALEAGVDGLRLNPGNIKDPEKVKEITRRAKEREVPIRIGVNAGSLPGRPKEGAGVRPPTEEVVADRVGPEQVLAARELVGLRKVSERVGLRSEQRCEDRDPAKHVQPGHAARRHLEEQRRQ